MHDIKKIRKMLIWWLPLSLGISIGSFWMISHEIIPTIDQLILRAPIIRIGPVALLFPFVGAFSAMGVVIAILRAIPYQGKIVKVLENIFNVIVFASAIVLFLIATTATLVQIHYMPNLGYSRCGLLQGNPTLWFTDWVKNPDWCTRGKSMEWVNEQARQSSSTQTAK